MTPKGSQHTHYETDADLRLRLARAGVAHSYDGPEGGAVVVLLDVDGCGYGVVKVDTHPDERDLQAVEQALAHLMTVRDEQRRQSSHPWAPKAGPRAVPRIRCVEGASALHSQSRCTRFVVRPSRRQ